MSGHHYHPEHDGGRMKPAITQKLLDNLKRKALAATPGVWKHYRAPLRKERSASVIVNEIQAAGLEPVVRWPGFDGMDKKPAKVAANAAFIAAANPCTILALVDFTQRALLPQKEQHPDDIAVDRFAATMKEKLKLAREKGRGGWQQCDPAKLSNMLREHVEKGDPLDVANFCMFLWSLGKPIGDARPVVDLKLTPLDGIQVWIEAYTNRANGQHFMGHGRIVQLLREYLALRKLLAPRTPPPLPETHYNGCGDGSEPLYTANMVHLYALQHASQLTLPAGPLDRIRKAVRGRGLNDFPGNDAELLESAANIIAEDGFVLRAPSCTALNSPELPAGPVTSGTQELFLHEDSSLDIDADASKPLCRFKLYVDNGDSSVGEPSRQYWALDDNIVGTVLADLMAASTSPAVAIQSKGGLE